MKTAVGTPDPEDSSGLSVVPLTIRGGSIACTDVRVLSGGSTVSGTSTAGWSSSSWIRWS